MQEGLSEVFLCLFYMRSMFRFCQIVSIQQGQEKVMCQSRSWSQLALEPIVLQPVHDTFPRHRIAHAVLHLSSWFQNSYRNHPRFTQLTFTRRKGTPLLYSGKIWSSFHRYTTKLTRTKNAPYFWYWHFGQKGCPFYVDDYGSSVCGN